MAETQRLLEIKKDMKKKSPHFIRQDTWKYPRLTNDPKWRKPRGKHSKMREKRIGKHKRVEVGYRTPSHVRGMTLTGMAHKLIHTMSELQNLNAKADIAILSSTLGLQSKIEITKKAQELGIKTNTRLDKLNARLAEMKKARAESKPAAAKVQPEARQEKKEPKLPENKPAVETKTAEQKTNVAETKKPESKTERKVK